MASELRAQTRPLRQLGHSPFKIARRSADTLCMSQEEHIICVGADHTSASWAARKLVAMEDDWAIGTMRRACAIDYVFDALVLSTCNRVEIYAAISAQATPDQRSDVTRQMRKILVDLAWHRATNRQCKVTLLEPDPKLVRELGLSAEQAAPPDANVARTKARIQAQELERSLSACEGPQAITRLISTTMGLASALGGDRKILGQVKHAHRRAIRSGHVQYGRSLDKLCRIAIDHTLRLRSSGHAPANTDLPTYGAVAGFLAGLHAEVMIQSPAYRIQALVIGSGAQALAAAKQIAYDPCAVEILSDNPSEAANIVNAAQSAHPGRETVVSIQPTDICAVKQRTYDFILCTQALDSRQLTIDDISLICKRRQESYAAKQVTGDDLPSLTVVDLTEGAGVDPDVGKIDGVSYWAVANLDRHFGRSLKRGQEKLAAADDARTDAERDYQQWLAEQRIADDLKHSCRAIDQQTHMAIERVQADASLSLTERDSAVRSIRRQTAKHKHEIVSQIRARAGIAATSRLTSTAEHALIAA